MAANVGNAVLTIVPKLSPGGLAAVGAELGGVDAAGSAAGTSFMSKMKAGAIAGAAAFVAVGAAVGKIITESVQQYANYEQLVGGVDTLFKESSSIVQQYASNAYQTAGLSANQYMETVTSFSASLLQSLGSDTAAAAKYADTAITDMADNANKMGTSMESIQNAYQGFAKQNYTMLDNLKLGYGGTKTEMERLLADAEKISGIKYDISSYADIVSAIHVVQQEMGITGTTALEAAHTIEGSINSMKASWSNLLVGLASDNADIQLLVTQFSDSVQAVASNVVPRITEVINSLGPALNSMANSLLPIVISGITGMLPGLINAVMQLTIGIVNALPQIVQQLVAALPTVITQVVQGLMQCLPQLVQGLIQLVLGLVSAIPEIMMAFVDATPQIISSIVEGLLMCIPQLIVGAVQLFLALVQAIPQAIPYIIAALPQIVSGIAQGLGAFGWQMVEAGLNLIKGIGDGIVAAKDWLIGKIKELCNNALDAIKAFFGIHSPSTVMRDVVGKNIVAGIGLGITGNAGLVDDAIDSVIGGIIQRTMNPIGIEGRVMGGSNRSTAQTIEGAINALHADLGRIIENYTPTATNRELARTVRAYA